MAAISRTSTLVSHHACEISANDLKIHWTSMVPNLPMNYSNITWWRHQMETFNGGNCYVISFHITGLFVKHYINVIMTTMASKITSFTVVYSTVYSDADQRKHQSSASLVFVWGIHRDRWIPHTKGQLRGKCFHLMTSSWGIHLW